MNFLMNILWFIFAGLFQSILWFFSGVLWSITIIGIPLGRQCFKFARLTAFPFGKRILYGGGFGSFLLNILWMIFTGFPMAMAAVMNGVVLCFTIIGIPFGLQCFKFAKLALMPFGSQVVKV